MSSHGEKSAESQKSRGSIPREFLAFKLGNEEYGIDILKVQEIRGFEPTTKLANMPPFILGLCNLRGEIVPIIDMRIKFSLDEPVYDALTATIILNIGKRVRGIVVDSVSDVVALDPDSLSPPPSMGTLMETDNLIGLATLGERMLILVDIEKLMDSPEMGLTDGTT